MTFQVPIGRHISRPFIVNYDGSRCAECGDEVEPGETALFDDGELVHEVCGPYDPPVAVCDTCWQMKSLAGRCGCE